MLLKISHLYSYPMEYVVHAMYASQLVCMMRLLEDHFAPNCLRAQAQARASSARTGARPPIRDERILGPRLNCYSVQMNAYFPPPFRHRDLALRYKVLMLIVHVLQSLLMQLCSPSPKSGPRSVSVPCALWHSEAALSEGPFPASVLSFRQLLPSKRSMCPKS